MRVCVWERVLSVVISLWACSSCVARTKVPEQQFGLSLEGGVALMLHCLVHFAAWGHTAWVDSSHFLFLFGRGWPVAPEPASAAPGAKGCLLCLLLCTGSHADSGQGCSRGPRCGYNTMT